MTRHQPPNVPFVEAALVASKHRPTAIVLELSMTTSDEGAALGFATNLHRQSTRAARSFHYMLDEAKTYRGVRDNRAAYNIPHRALGVLLCAQPVTDVLMWEEPTHYPVMERAARLVAQLCLAYKIKPRYLTSADEARWKKRRTRRRGGIIVRVPGEWPSSAFLILVQAHMIKKES